MFKTLVVWSLTYKAITESSKHFDVVSAAMSSAASSKLSRSSDKNKILSTMKYEPVAAVG